MRTQGSLRVVLNTKLWPNMTLEKGNEKSLRFTAMDSEKDIKIYLIMVSKLLLFLILHVLSDFFCLSFWAQFLISKWGAKASPLEALLSYYESLVLASRTGVICSRF